MTLLLKYITAIFLFSAPQAYADIYKYVNQYGQVIYTDDPKHKGYKLLVKSWKGWAERSPSKGNPFWKINQSKYDPYIKKLSKEYKLPRSLIHAVIMAESTYDPNAVSKAGAVGLMQLMPETAKRYGVINRKNPLDNMHGGVRYLNDLMIMFNYDLKLVLAAYNAGENAVKRYNYKIPPYKETKNYVKKVINYYNKYRITMS